MPRTIDQFMWPFQPHFRMSLERLAESALGDIGTSVAPKALLVGFARTDVARHAVCIEPEKGLFTQADLASVPARAEELYQADPERHALHTDPDLHERRQAGLLDNARGEALCEALSASPAGAGRTFLAGSGGP